MKNFTKFYLTLFVVISMFGCTTKTSQKINGLGNIDTHTNCKCTNHSCVIAKQHFPKENVTIGPLGIVDNSDVEDVIRIIQNFYGYTCTLGWAQLITDEMYLNGNKNILDGNVLLRKYFSNQKVVYIIDKQLVVNGDYLRGYAATNGGTVIIRGEKSFLRETLIHEIGHTLGLSHCSDLTCVMAVSNDQYDSGTFCNKCSRQIGFNNK